MEDLLRFIVEHLVAQPGDVHVTRRQGRTGIVFEVRVAPDDAGRVIGRSGATINAIRTVMQLAGARRRRKVWVEVKDDEPPKEAPVPDEDLDEDLDDDPGDDGRDAPEDANA